jgi:hypothetical protein
MKLTKSCLGLPFPKEGAYRECTVSKVTVLYPGDPRFCVQWAGWTASSPSPTSQFRIGGKKRAGETGTSGLLPWEYSSSPSESLPSLERDSRTNSFTPIRSSLEGREANPQLDLTSKPW